MVFYENRTLDQVSYCLWVDCSVIHIGIHFKVVYNIMVWNNVAIFLQCMWYPTLPASRSQAPEPVSGHLLRGCDLLHSGVRWLCTRHLAVSAVYGDYDMRRSNSIANTGQFSSFYMHCGDIVSYMELTSLSSINLTFFALYPVCLPNRPVNVFSQQFLCCTIQTYIHLPLTLTPVWKLIFIKLF